MALKQQLHQRQVQKLILAPALQQAIKLLPMTNLDLIEVIDAELSENPMLEIKEETSEQEQDSDVDSKENEGKIEDFLNEQIGEKDQDFEKYFHEYFDDGFRSLSINKKEAPVLENFVSKDRTLWDHLDWQANLTFYKEKEKEIARNIIGNINEDGYLISSVEEIAKVLDVSIGEVERIREKIKRFDPISIGSLTLQEAMLTQLEYLKIDDEVIQKIISDYLPLLEKSDYALLGKELDLPLSDIKSRIDVIKGLNPTPGVKYSQEKTEYVVPDIIVRKEDDKLVIIIDDEGLPKLRISRFYKELLAKSSKEKSDTYPYLKEHMKKAFWFLRSLDQRNQTIYKVAKYIVNRQKDFLEKGLEYIKPLTLMELAEEIGVHESTVGRVVANKHMLTSRGTFSLKYFFHKSLTGDYGEEISSLRVKEHIKKLVEKEERNDPLSDIEIESILSKENFRIARRTVAKYRKQLKIPPSHVRKRKYLMEVTE